MWLLLGTRSQWAPLDYLGLACLNLSISFNKLFGQHFNQPLLPKNVNIKKYFSTLLRKMNQIVRN